MLPLRKIVRHSVLVFIFRINTWRSPHANNYAKISVQSCTRRQTIQLHLDNAAFLHFPSSQSNEISPYSKATMVKHKYVIFNNAQQKELKRIYSIKLAKLIVKGEKVWVLSASCEVYEGVPKWRWVFGVPLFPESALLVEVLAYLQQHSFRVFFSHIDRQTDLLCILVWCPSLTRKEPPYTVSIYSCELIVNDKCDSDLTRYVGRVCLISYCIENRIRQNHQEDPPTESWGSE